MSDKRKTKKRKEEFGENTESETATREEYAVAKWLKSNVPTKKTKFLNHHVQYFTGTKAIDALLTSKWATGKNPIFLTRQDVTEFCHQMLLHKLFHRAKKVPVTEQELKGKSKKKDTDKTGKSGDEKDGDKGSSCETTDAKDKKKRKIRLEMHMEQVFLDTADAYVWIYDPMPWYYWLFGALVVLATVAICMFPLWPSSVRKGVYYLSMFAAAFLVFLLVLAVLRVVVFCVVWMITLSRHHIWLLPNLTEDVGFFASFWPLYKYEYKGVSTDSEKSGKSKKKRKKDKQSDDEGEKTPLIDKGSDKSEPVKDKELVKEDAPPAAEASSEKQSESDSENSQRSSTDRDFEMVDREDVEYEAKA